MSKQKIVITGAPSSGKSTTLARFADVFGSDIVVVPESAVILLSGGFPAPAHNDLEQIKAFQKAILQVQAGIELVFSQQNPNTNLMIFERGALDGSGFWPPGPKDFLAEFKVDVQKELAKYDYVLFFELPEEKDFGGKSRVRFHDYNQSLHSQKILREIWQKHPHFIEIKATEIFADKIQAAIAVVKDILNK